MANCHAAHTRGNSDDETTVYISCNIVQHTACVGGLGLCMLTSHRVGLCGMHGHMPALYGPEAIAVT
jgi:hypothetical protein